MTSIIVITGLPGSGKTHFARQLMSDLLADNRSVLWMDDPSVALPEYPDTDPRSYVVKDKSSMVLQAMEYVVSSMPDYFILSDPYLCLAKGQDSCLMLMQSLGLNVSTVRWVQFENDMTQCLRNAAARKDNRNVGGFIKSLSPKYHFRANAEVVPVWKPEA